MITFVDDFDSWLKQEQMKQVRQISRAFAYSIYPTIFGTGKHLSDYGRSEKLKVPNLKLLLL